jgi:hypothetical protein
LSTISGTVSFPGNPSEITYLPTVVSTTPDIVFYDKNLWFSKLSSGVEIFEDKSKNYKEYFYPN